MATAVVSRAAAIASAETSRRFGVTGDQIAHLVTFIFAASVLLVTVFLVYELWIHSGPSRAKFGFSFLTGKTWDPVADKFGALPFIYGTVLTSFLALLDFRSLGRRRGHLPCRTGARRNSPTSARSWWNCWPRSPA